MMTRALWAAPVRNTLFLLSGALFLVIAVTAYGQIRLNNWNKPFYDALSHHDFENSLIQLGVFGLIAGALLVLNVAQRWLGETLKLKLRQGLAHGFDQNWLKPGRAFRLANAGAMGVNPDQRMHEDARHLTELSADLGIGLLQSSILLATFVAMLWTLSSDFVFHLGGRQLRGSGLHGVGRHRVFRVGLAAELLGGPKSGRPQRGALRARGRHPLLAGARQRAHRCHHAQRRRSG